MKKGYDQCIVIPDAHFPYEDKKTFQTVLNFLRDQKPDIAVLIGDWVDCYSASRFDKDPDRGYKLQWEFDQARKGLEQVREAVGDARIIYIEGNHEVRIKTYLVKHPELYGLRDLTIERQLRLDELNIEYMDFFLWKNTFLFTHGTKCTKYGASGELDIHGISGMSGHNHRIMSFFKTQRTNTLVWHNIGHICDIKQADYVKNPNWQQGIGMVYFNRSNRRFVSSVFPILENKLMFGGKLYEPGGVTSLWRGMKYKLF